jgi:microsomal dipeptidase-like Zn-dependent dipeptidase
MTDDLHKKLLVVDALQASDWRRDVLEELLAGGVSAVHVTLAFWESAREALAEVGRWNRRFNEHGDILIKALSGADIERAGAAGRLAVILGFQNASPIEDDIDLVEAFHDLGVRVMQLTYNNLNLVGAGHAEAVDPGLSLFGREVVREMNRVGMVVDLSHCGERTTLDAIEASERPVAVTHANPTWFHDIPRNKSPRVIDALAAHDGMLGFSIYPNHIPGGADCTLEEFCAMVARTAETMGTQRLGLGTDLCRGLPDSFVGWMRYGRWSPKKSGAGPVWPEQPAWFATGRDFPNLTRGLAAAGFSDDEVAGIMGRNWLRFFTGAFAPVDA